MTEEHSKAIMAIIKSRCVTCPECETEWGWAGTFTSHGMPVVRHKLGGNRHSSIYVRRFLLEQASGKALGARRASTRCKSPTCVNPELLQALTHSQIIKRTHKSGKMVNQASRMRTAMSKRKTSKLSDAGVQDIRTSTEHRTVLMARYGITEAYYYMLRKGQFRKDYANPFAGLFTGLAANQARKAA